MMAWALSLLRTVYVVLIVLVILTQPVSVHIVKDGAFLLRFNFMFLSFSINTKDDRNKKKKNKVNISAIIKAVKYCLAGSHVEVRSLIAESAVQGTNAFPSDAVINIPRYILLVYLERRSASLSYSPSDEYSQRPLDVTVSTALLRLFFTAVVYFQESFKIKRRRGRTNKKSII
jgi:hypothetical protein